jgi:hypothetical protein
VFDINVEQVDLLVFVGYVSRLVDPYQAVLHLGAVIRRFVNPDTDG